MLSSPIYRPLARRTWKSSISVELNNLPKPTLKTLSGNQSSARDRGISAEKLERKEAKTMTYTKPEVLIFGRATDVVRMQVKGEGQLETPEPTYSIPAYEADE